MNNIRRKELDKIESRLSVVKTEVLDITNELSYICDEENNSLDNMEKFSGTDRYAAIEDAANNMEDALNLLEEVVDNIDNAVTSINEASR